MDSNIAINSITTLSGKVYFASNGCLTKFEKRIDGDPFYWYCQKDNEGNIIAEINPFGIESIDYEK